MITIRNGQLFYFYLGHNSLSHYIFENRQPNSRAITFITITIKSKINAAAKALACTSGTGVPT